MQVVMNLQVKSYRFTDRFISFLPLHDQTFLKTNKYICLWISKGRCGFFKWVAIFPTNFGPEEHFFFGGGAYFLLHQCDWCPS